MTGFFDAMKRSPGRPGARPPRRRAVTSGATYTGRRSAGGTLVDAQALCESWGAPMDWNDLRYFLTIARSGSLAKAARELSVEHTTVSRRLGALEEDLGTRLFARGPAGLVLTSAGKNMLPIVECIAEQFFNDAASAGIYTGSLVGSVRLT